MVPFSAEFRQKWRGGGKIPPRVSPTEMGWSWIGGFFGIALVGWLHDHLLAPGDLVLIIGSFGASAVLIYGAINVPLAQPRNLVGGHLLSAVVGVAMQQSLGHTPWLAGAMAVATAIVVMQQTRTLHPPGGATALIAVIGSERIHELGYLYVLVPAVSGALLMLAVALLVNNLAPGRRYPVYWWGEEIRPIQCHGCRHFLQAENEGGSHLCQIAGVRADGLPSQAVQRLSGQPCNAFVRFEERGSRG
ncbi:MAG: HPP family protein [Magnetococcales bacterium]|nr:HPP family protein [Magnetococcales bacterium]